MVEEPLYQIGEVAERVGLSLRTIRHYEEVRLVLPTGRSTGGFRLYTGAEVEKLRLIKLLKPLDFSLEEMRELLQTMDRLEASDQGDERIELLERLSLFATIAQERCDRLREQLHSAEALTLKLRQVGLKMQHPAAREG